MAAALKLMKTMSEYNVSLQSFDGDIENAEVEELSDTDAKNSWLHSDTFGGVLRD